MRPGGLLLQDIQLATLGFIPPNRWWESIYLANTLRGPPDRPRARRTRSGGMGVVYLAERADGAFESRVALKLLPAGSLPADAIRLFERERQILARLSHEHIARLLDGGVDSLGRPFLAMHASPEQIEKRPVTTASDVYSLGVVLFQLVTGRLPYETADGMP